MWFFSQCELEKDREALGFQLSYPFLYLIILRNFWLLFSTVLQKPSALCQTQQLQGALLIRAHM